MDVDLCRVGIWHRYDQIDIALLQEVERLGYGAVWIGGLPAGGLTFLDDLLESTNRIVIATGIVNIWREPPSEVASTYRRLIDAYPGRFLVGLGIGHREAIPQYRQPLQSTVSYLDELDEEGMPASGLVLAALGPKMLELAGARTGGAHPYLTTPKHTAYARRILGPDALLAPEQKVLLSDADDARVVARRAVAGRLQRANYRNHLMRLGWEKSDVTDQGSDRLIDSLVAHGSVETVMAGITAHLKAGANHVAVQALGPTTSSTYRVIAERISQADKRH